MLFYFTGTGNSLYAAKGIDPDPISIPQAIHQEPLEFTADAIGIVCPVYGHEVPQMVREFLQKSRFRTSYFYTVLTCGIRPAYINVLLMVDNWLPGFDMDEQKQMDKGVDAHLRQIAADIAARKHWIAPVTDADRAAHQEFLSRMAQLPSDAWQHLIRVTDRCIGCGICEQVCPSASIRVVDGKAVHTPGNCQTCLSCVHSCPPKAIGLTVPEKNPNARYRNEHIRLAELIRANQQV